MTLTVRSSSLTGATTAARALTHAEMDANWAHVIESSNQNFTPSGSGAVARAVQEALRDIHFNVKGYGAEGDGSTDDTTAITNAVSAAVSAGGGTVYFPEGTYKITSQVTIGDTTQIVLKGNGLKSQIKKAFNGAMFSLGKRNVMEDLYLNGDGANFTGRGVIIPTASSDLDGPKINRVIMRDMASHCIEFTTDSAGRGTSVLESEFQVRSSAAACVKFPADTSLGNRRFIGCYFATDPGLDISGSKNSVIVGNEIGYDGTTTSGGIVMDEDTEKATVTGNRFGVGQNQTTIEGTSNTFIGNVHSGGFTFGTSATSCKSHGNIEQTSATAYNAADNAVNDVEIYAGDITYTPAWTAASVNPAIGDGTIAGFYSRIGPLVTVHVSIVMGSTTTFGTGVWRISAPTNQKPLGGTGEHLGTAMFLDSGTAWFTGTARWTTNGFELYGNNTAAQVSSSVPFTWAQNDVLHFSITYFA
jgi:hypothetical protein